MSKYITTETRYGYCRCGCGQKTKIVEQNHKRSGHVKGQPMTYLKGHHARVLVYASSPQPKTNPAPGPNPGGLCTCGCGQAAPLAPSSNKTKGLVRGKPTRFVKGHQFRGQQPPDAERRFWPKVNKDAPGGCWLWTASTYLNGYGQFWTGTHLTGAHRYSYMLAHGEIPHGYNVCHNCPDGDNPLCVNPAHLMLGTQQQNVDDMLRKGRNSQAKGEKQGIAKLTGEQVKQIRQMHGSGTHNYPELASLFNVTVPTVRCVVLRMTWKHI